MDAHVHKGSFALPYWLWEWAVEQPEGASGLIRRLLEQERQSREASRAPVGA